MFHEFQFGNPQQRRIYRGVNHAFLLNQIRAESQCLTFEVFSETSGKVYDIQIHAEQGMSCSCPDHSQNGTQLCKHMIFVLTRRLALGMLPIPNPGARWGEKIRFSQSQFDSFHQTTTALLDRFVAEVKVEVSKPPPPTLGIQFAERQRPYGKDETCCFCLDELALECLEGGALSHQWCPKCENLWHPDCYASMKKHHERKHQSPSCPFCRTVLKFVCAPIKKSTPQDSGSGDGVRPP